MGTPGSRQGKGEPSAATEAALAPTDLDFQSRERTKRKEPLPGEPKEKYEETTRGGAGLSLRATNAPIGGPKLTM